MHDEKKRYNLRAPCLMLWAIFCIMISLKTSWVSDTSHVLGEVQTKPNEVQQKVVIEPSVEDKGISKRLKNILQATKWFENIQIKVEDGVVFLHGNAKTEQHKEWASNLANKTEDVVAVVNNIDIPVVSLGEFKQQLSGAFQEQWVGFLRLLPYLIFSLIILIFFGASAWFSALCASDSETKIR